MFFFSIVCSLCLVIPFHVIVAQDHHQQHGKVNFETSCGETAQQKINTGLALLHHMMYEQAEQEFAAAVQAQPDCAMAQWGIALSIIHPLWGERPSDDYFKKGQEALMKAGKQKNLTAREAAYIKALTPFYENWQNTSYQEQLKAFETGFEQLHRTYPNDVDAAALYALAHIATAPKTDKTFAHQKKSGAMLEKLHAQNPEHPGLFHYIIHAYDNPMLAKDALRVAKAYDKIAPNVPHALHMPSHIFIRLGYWPEAISWNVRSADAALKHPIGNATSMHYAHALDYLIYSYLQQGKDKKAQEVVNKMSAIQNFHPSLATAYAVAAVPARFYLERGQWKEAAALPKLPMGTLPWEKYPGAEALTHFARGIGAARSGNNTVASDAITELDRLHAKMEQTGETYWAAQTAVQRKSVEAWRLFSTGKKEQAIQLMREAANEEDGLDKHPVTPGAILPARELLGDMLLLAKQPKEAAMAYEACLQISPKRHNSLYGVARAADLVKDSKKARMFYSSLHEITTEADTERPSIKEARKNGQKK